FSSRRRHTRFSRDWSSDVCSSDLVAVHTGDPDLVVGARRNSPLVVGVGDGENFLASDVAAFIAHTRDAIELGQDQVVELRTGGRSEERRVGKECGRRWGGSGSREE